MSTATAPRKAPGAPEARGRTRSAVLALARFEAVRLARHPVVVLAALGYLVRLAWPGGGGGDYPVLQDADRDTQLALLLMGLAVLVAANAAVLRAARHGTDTHFDVLVLRPGERTVAHLLALVPVALLFALMAGAAFALAAGAPGAVGHGSAAELATGPLVVLLLGAGGVLLGRLTRSAFAAPMVVVVLIAVLFVAGGGVLGPVWVRWLFPVAFEGGADPLPSDLLGRPAAWHLVYLAGLTGLAGAGAVLLGGGRAAAVRAAALGALALTAGGAVAQGMAPYGSVEDDRRRATDRPASLQQCVRHGETTYCAFPEFVPWTDEWDEVVRDVRALVPGEVRDHALTVRQRVHALHGARGSIDAEPSYDAPATTWPEDDRAAGTPDAIPAGTSWGGGREEAELAAGTAYTLVMGRAPYAAGEGALCDGRGVLIGWLTGRATGGSEGGLAAVGAGRNGGGLVIETGPGGVDVGAVVLRDREYAVVRELLERPGDEVAKRVAASWDELTAPGTDTARAAGLLGVRAPAPTGGDRQWSCA